MFKNLLLNTLVGLMFIIFFIENVYPDSQFSLRAPLRFSTGVKEERVFNTDVETKPIEVKALFKIVRGTPQEITFGPPYSRMKIGNPEDIRRFGKLLVDMIRKDKGDDLQKNPQDWVVACIGGYGIPNTAFLLSQIVADELRLPRVALETGIKASRIGMSYASQARQTTRELTVHARLAAGESEIHTSTSLKGKNILLIDDCTITGTILRQGIYQLRQAGVQDVDCYIVAIFEDPNKDNSFEQTVNLKAFEEDGVLAYIQVLNNPEALYTTKTLSYIYDLAKDNHERFLYMLSQLNPQAVLNFYLYSVEYYASDVKDALDDLVGILKAKTSLDFPKAAVFRKIGSKKFFDEVGNLLKGYNRKVPIDKAEEILKSIKNLLLDVSKQSLPVKAIFYDLNDTLEHEMSYRKVSNDASQIVIASELLGIGIDDVKVRIQKLKEFIDLKGERAVIEDVVKRIDISQEIIIGNIQRLRSIRRHAEEVTNIDIANEIFNMVLQRVKETISDLKKRLQAQGLPLRQHVIGEEFGISWEELDRGIAILVNPKDYIKEDVELRNMLLDQKERGCRLFVVSDGPTLQANGILDALGVKDIFEDVITADKAGCNKPDPAFYKYALKEAGLGLDPAQVVMIGNSIELDILPTYGLGMHQLLIGSRNDILEITKRIENLKLPRRESAKLEMRVQRAEGAMVGTWVGDSLGMPLEGKSREEILKLQKQKQYGGPIAHIIEGKDRINTNTREKIVLPAGHGTDDTISMIALGQTISEVKGFNRKIFLDRFASYCDPKLGISRTTMGILEAWQQDFDTWQELVEKNMKASNSPASRIVPLAIMYSYDERELKEQIIASCKVTNHHPLSAVGALLQGFGISYLFMQEQGVYFNIDEFVQRLILNTERWEDEIFGTDYLGEDKRIFSIKLREMRNFLQKPPNTVTEEDVIKTLGNGFTAQDSIVTALYCFLRNPYSFRDAVIYAVNLGGDTDTLGAMTGALSGAFLGKSAIPKGWVELLSPFEIKKDRGEVIKISTEDTTACADDMVKLNAQRFYYAPEQDDFSVIPLSLTHQYDDLSIVSQAGIRVGMEWSFKNLTPGVISNPKAVLFDLGSLVDIEVLTEEKSMPALAVRPGSDELLKTLHKVQIPIFITTAIPEGTAELIMKRLGFYHLCRRIYSIDNEKSKYQIKKEIKETLGLENNNELLTFGNSPDDMDDTYINVGILSDFSKGFLFQEKGCNFIVSSLRDWRTYWEHIGFSSLSEIDTEYLAKEASMYPQQFAFIVAEKGLGNRIEVRQETFIPPVFRSSIINAVKNAKDINKVDLRSVNFDRPLRELLPIIKIALGLEFDEELEEFKFIVDGIINSKYLTEAEKREVFLTITSYSKCFPNSLKEEKYHSYSFELFAQGLMEHKLQSSESEVFRVGVFGSGDGLDLYQYRKLLEIYGIRDVKFIQFEIDEKRMEDSKKFNPDDEYMGCDLTNINPDTARKYMGQLDVICINNVLHEIFARYGKDVTQGVFKTTGSFLKQGGRLILRDGIYPPDGNRFVWAKFDNPDSDKAYKAFTVFKQEFGWELEIPQESVDFGVMIKFGDLAKFITKMLYVIHSDWRTRYANAGEMRQVYCFADSTDYTVYLNRAGLSISRFLLGREERIIKEWMRYVSITSVTEQDFQEISVTSKNVRTSF